MTGWKPLVVHKKPFLVLELGTGFMDGWYSTEPEGVRQHWDEVRPGHKQVVVQLVDDGGGSGYFPDSVALNRQSSRDFPEGRQRPTAVK